MVALGLTPLCEARERRLAYVDQHSPQTLAQGLAEYYAGNRGRVIRPNDLPPESAALFRSHDLCHVIFGLDTLADEVMADTRTLLSCDVGLKRYAHYLTTDTQAEALFKEIGIWVTIGATVRALPRVLVGLMEATRMNKRWPWRPPDAFMSRSLADLRNEFGIRVI